MMRAVPGFGGNRAGPGREYGVAGPGPELRRVTVPVGAAVARLCCTIADAFALKGALCQPAQHHWPGPGRSAARAACGGVRRRPGAAPLAGPSRGAAKPACAGVRRRPAPVPAWPGLPVPSGHRPRRAHCSPPGRNRKHAGGPPICSPAVNCPGERRKSQTAMLEASAGCHPFHGGWGRVPMGVPGWDGPEGHRTSGVRAPRWRPVREQDRTSSASSRITSSPTCA